VDSKVTRRFLDVCQLDRYITKYPYNKCVLIVDGVVGKRACLTGLILRQTGGPQFEPGSMHKADNLDLTVAA